MIIITGGAGFIGANVIWQLNRFEQDNILVVDNLSSTEKWRNLANLRYADYIQRDDFLNLILAGGLPAGTTNVIHLGACSSTTEKDADFLMRNNYHYSMELCKAALKANARFIYASSAATYGAGEHGFNDGVDTLLKLKPLNMYGYSKHLFDLWCYRNNFFERVAGLKFFNVYGPDEYHKGPMKSMVCRAVEQMRDTGKIRLFKSSNADWKDGEFLRDFVYVKDCSALIVWLIHNPAVNGLLNVGSGIARSWNDLARATLSALYPHKGAFDKYIEYIDMPESIRPNYQYRTCADMAWLQGKKCPLKFSNLEDGVNDYVRNYLMADNSYLNSLP